MNRPPPTARRAPALAFALVAAGACVTAIGGSAGPARAADGPAALRAARVPEGAVVAVDGRLDDPAWQAAPVLDEFTGISPTEGFAPAGLTRVRILYDDARIYFAWECRFDEPTPVRGYYSDREDVNRDDQVAMLIDPFGDGRRAYHFWINALGVQQDMVVTLDGAWNPAWDTVFKSEGRLVEGGYDVEVAIPFRSLRFDPKSGRPWRILLKRKFTARDEYVALPMVRRDAGNELLQYAELPGPAPKRSGVGVELMPTVVGRTGLDRATPQDDLAWRKPGFPETVDPGFDFKWQATPSLTLDATVNPDFSQVEADVDRIDNNLRFALFLSEQRPFFLEGGELFGGLLYTRSIVDPIYGVKFSGKAGPVGIGVLHALDERPAPSFVGERPTPGFDTANLDGAFAFNTYAGAKIDVGRQSTLAVAFADKEVVRDEQHVAFHRGGSASFDWNPDPKTNVYIGGGVSDTGVPGGDRVTGGNVGASVSRNTRLDGFGVSGELVTPGYRKEMGFLTTPDRARLSGWGRRRFEPAHGPQWIDLYANFGHALEQLDSTPVPSSGSAGGSVQMRLPGITDVGVGADIWDQLFAGKDFQGGGVNFFVNNRGLDNLTLSVNGRLGDAVRFSDGTLSFRGHIGASIGVRLARRVNMSFSTALDRLGRAGEPVDQLWIYRLRTVIGFTRWLSLRFIAQGRKSTAFTVDRKVVESGDRLDLSALLRVEPSPGTAVFVGWGQRFHWAAPDTPRTDRIDLFIKGSVLIRL